MRKFSFWFLLCVGCASHQNKDTFDQADFDIDVPWEKNGQKTNEGAEPNYFSVNYQLTWEGKDIGEAREVYHRSGDKIRILRKENMLVERDGTKVPIETEIVIETDLNLWAKRVELNSKVGALSHRGIATRADNQNWVIAFDGEKVRQANRDAVPAELVSYILKKKNISSFNGDVLLAGYGFAVVPMRLKHDGKQAVSILETQWGDIETDMTLAKDGSLLEATAGVVSAHRASPDTLEDIAPTEVLNPSHLTVSGTGNVLKLSGLQSRLPTFSPGISIRDIDDTLLYRFESSKNGFSPRAKSINDEVDRLLDESHDAPGATGASALKLGRGDCSAHSALFVDLALERGLEAKVVTGFRLTDNQLVRHRWAVVKDQGEWFAVDPTFGEAPVPYKTHVPLAVHDATTRDMALVDEALFRDLSKVTAKWQK